MKTKTLWLIWMYLFGFCCVLGFIPEPPTFIKALLVILGIGFFIPGALLLYQGDRSCIRKVRLLRKTRINRLLPYQFSTATDRLCHKHNRF